MKTLYALLLAISFSLFFANGALAISETKIVAADSQADDHFGTSVDISGDYAIVGAFFDNEAAGQAGAAYIFHRSGEKDWGTGTKIMASDAQPGDLFGTAVAIDGDYAIVGANAEDDGGSNAGAAYVFHRTGENTWDAGTKLVAADPDENDYFGNAVAISGDYAIVAADYEDEAAGMAGAAYIFHRTGVNTWDTGTKIMAPDAETEDVFGKSVSLSGDYAMVGAYQEDQGGSNAGAAYIFHRTGDNTWDAGTKLVASDAEAGDTFGMSVSLSGDYAVVGASGEDTGGSFAGAAYIFHRTDTNTWTETTKIMASDAGAGDAFGAVAIDSDHLIVGATWDDAGGAGAGAGAAYLFYHASGNTWIESAKIVASDAEADDHFGGLVAISGDYAIAAAMYEDPGSVTDAGAAYIYKHDLPTALAGKVVAADYATDDSFGYAVAIAGDYGIAGALSEDDGGANAGAAYVFYRTGDQTWDAGTKIVASDAEAGDYFGAAVGLSGDYAIVGAYGEDSIPSNSGAAYIFQRTDTNAWGSQTKIVPSDTAADDYFGNAASLSGDYAIVGAYNKAAGATPQVGAAYIFNRTDTNTWDGGTKLVAPDGDSGDLFGYAVGLSGDYAVVGAIYEDDGGADAGAAYVFHRTALNTWDAGTKLQAPDAEAGDYFGWSVALAGDYVIVGAPNEDAGGVNAGAAYVFYRTALNTWDAGTKIVTTDAEAADLFGISVSLSGPYAVVGAAEEDTGGAAAGAAYLFNRTDTNTWSAGTKIVAADAEAGDYFGISAGISGYYTMVGAYHEDPNATSDAGSAYFYKHDLPTSIDLLAFEAEWTDAGALLSWLTGSETECGAFTLLRCELGDLWNETEPFCDLVDYRELAFVIPCGDSMFGADYEALDTTADPSASYAYILREYETTGGVNDYGPVTLYSLKYGDEQPGGEELPGDDDEREPSDDDAQAPENDDSEEVEADNEDMEEEEAGCGL